MNGDTRDRQNRQVDRQKNKDRRKQNRQTDEPEQTREIDRGETDGQ
jgi:hypothetical protein